MAVPGEKGLGHVTGYRDDIGERANSRSKTHTLHQFLMTDYRSLITHRFYFGEMSELAEGARLEIACTTNRGTEGSNPSLSAKFYSV